MAVKTLTAPDLINLRKDKQRSRLYLAILQPGAVFKARINQVFSAYDRIVQVEYDTVTLGAYTDILNGETLWIGTTEGAYDVGIARIRKTPTSTILYIGETSEIEFADDQYLTVVNDFGLWAKPIYIDSNKNIFMDYDIAYTDQHEDCNPVPTMGSHAVVWLTGATVDIGFDASDSWVSNISMKL